MAKPLREIIPITEADEKPKESMGKKIGMAALKGLGNVLKRAILRHNSGSAGPRVGGVNDRYLGNRYYDLDSPKD